MDCVSLGIVVAMKKIVSFGDSFVFGSELLNNTNGSRAWAGLIAQKLGCEYVTHAVPGCGNDHIARQIYSWFSTNLAQDTLAIINWTWMCRWDFYIAEHETWITLGPTCVPDKLKGLVERTDAEDLIDFYKRRANSSLLWNKFRNLQSIYAAQQYLKHKGINAIQTYMDYELFNTQWHAPDYVQELQQLVLPELQLFDNKNFVDWSHSHGYPVTIVGNHPLEQAHAAAENYWEKIYKAALTI
jgi:hypothetical protein